MFNIISKTINAADIDDKLNQKLWDLYHDTHNITFEEFTLEWKKVNKISIFIDKKTQEIVGFVGIRYYSFLCIELSDTQTLSFGQVYIKPAFRGKFLIQRTVIKLLLQYKLKNPFSTLFFYTDALSYKPFLLMANHLANYYPNPFENNPYYIDELLDQIGEKYYPEFYQRDTKTTSREHNLLNDPSLMITKDKLKNQHIRFYASQNYDHNKGDGLLIICPMSIKNVIFFVSKLITKNIFSKKKQIVENI